MRLTPSTYLAVSCLLGALVASWGDCRAVQLGACCTGKDGVCYVTSEQSCWTAGYTYMGDGTQCFADYGGGPVSTCSNYGACCNEAGDCTVELYGDCVLGSNDGEYGGRGVSCSVGFCSGVCCSADSTCATATRHACFRDGLTWLGIYETCGPDPCPTAVWGACCYADSCVQTTEAICGTTIHGAYQGDGSVCATDPCSPPPGACCQTDGSCAATTEAGCSGVWKGAGTSCDPNPCRQIYDFRRRLWLLWGG